MPGKLRDITGQRFGSLLVKELEAIRGHAYWRCKCDCDGKIVVVRGTRMTQGLQISCGCWRANPAVRQAARYKLSARRRKQIARMGGTALATQRSAIAPTAS